MAIRSSVRYSFFYRRSMYRYGGYNDLLDIWLTYQIIDMLIYDESVVFHEAGDQQLQSETDKEVYSSETELETKKNDSSYTSDSEVQHESESHDYSGSSGWSDSGGSDSGGSDSGGSWD